MEITNASVMILSYNVLVKFKADGEEIMTEMSARKNPKEAMIEAMEIYKKKQKKNAETVSVPAIEDVKAEENDTNEQAETEVVDELETMTEPEVKPETEG
jgi:hypothetical protein